MRPVPAAEPKHTVPVTVWVADQCENWYSAAIDVVVIRFSDVPQQRPRIKPYAGVFEPEEERE